MKKIFWVILGGGVGIFAILAIWFHYNPVAPKQIMVEKKLSLGKDS
ncbi:MAG: hypothetical protein ORN98_08200 [Alphaproteobacteria bacterium]|nr:hypothetical protein [Alphaproteobacteria bacterium]